MLDLIIRGGCLVHPDHTEYADIAVKDGCIVGIGTGEAFSRAESVIDASGLAVLPGLIDSHVHIANPLGEFPSLDTYFTGTVAAAYGGCTSFIDFPFLLPGETPRAAMDRKLAEAKNECVIDYSFHPCLTSADPQSCGEIAEMLQEGFPSVKMFTIYRGSLMLEKNGLHDILKLVKRYNAVALIHAESAEMIERLIARAVADNTTTPADHARCRPPITEVEAMHSVLALARDTEAPVIFAHMTTGQSRRMLEETRRHVPIYTEVCPHYLALDESVYTGPDGCAFVCSPPIRSRDEGAGLWELVEQGHVDMVNSDHTDYSLAQKRAHAGFFPKIPNGLPTLENRALVFFSEGVAKGRISINRFAELTSTNQAKLMGLYPQKGVLAVGSDADITILDPAATRVHTVADQHMQSDYSPFEGMELTGRVVHTIVRGAQIIRDGVFTGTDFRGRLMKRQSPVLDLKRKD